MYGWQDSCTALLAWLAMAGGSWGRVALRSPAVEWVKRDAGACGLEVLASRGEGAS